MKYTLTLNVFLLLFLPLCWFGCSAGSNNAGTTLSTSGSRGGSATLTIKWPARSRIIPAGTNSVLVTISNTSGFSTSQEEDRPTSGVFSTLHFSDLPVGTLMVTITAYPQTGELGVALATATSPITIVNGQDTSLSITLSSTITKLVISPSTPTVKVGAQTTLTATAQDASGNVVIVAAGKITWSSTNTGVATVNSTTGVVTGVNTGNVSITATDSETGITSSVSLSVTSSSGGPGTAELDVVNILKQPYTPIWVAFQDGAGAWIQIEPVSTGVYQQAVTNSQGRYSFAIWDQAGTVVSSQIFAATTSETNKIYFSIDTPTTPKFTLSGMVTDVSGGAATDTWNTAFGHGTLDTGLFLPSPASYSMETLTGTYDLLATRSMANINNPTTVIPMTMFLDRGIVFSGNLTQNIDFSSSAAFDLDQNTVTVDGTPATFGDAMFITAHSSTISMGSTSNAGTSFTYSSLPPAESMSSDRYLIAAVSNFSETNLTTNSAGNETLNLPTMGLSGVTFTTTDPVHPTISWNAFTGAMWYFLLWANSGIDWGIDVTPGWLGSGTTLSYQMPDFSSVAGWVASWGLPASGTPSGTISAFWSSQSQATIFNQTNATLPFTWYDVFQSSTRRQGARQRTASPMRAQLQHWQRKL